MNIYVGNLAWKTRQKELKELFENFGEVNNAFIVRDKATRRSRGFGFVEMAEEQHAREAIEKLNNTVFLDRTIIVNEAIPKDEGESKSREEYEVNEQSEREKQSEGQKETEGQERPEEDGPAMDEGQAGGVTDAGSDDDTAKTASEEPENANNELQKDESGPDPDKKD